MEHQKEHINPDGLFKNPAFSQIVTTRGNGKTIYIGGQNAVNQNLEIVGKNDLALQTEQVMQNLEIALKACGAAFENLVKLNIKIVQGQDITKGFEVSQKYLRQSSAQPVVTVLFVAGLVNPDFFIEIDAIAFVPEA
jgi:enamine deaminase RidA (YjgF/YER057c/UK114 family)